MYIGNNLQVANPSYKIIDDISSGFNGSTTSFALQVSGATPVPFPINTQQVMISVNGVVQEPDPSGSAGFKLLGSNIVFSSAPANGHAFFGTILAGADYVTAGSEFPDGSVTAPSFTFEADQDSGFYRIGSGDVGYSSNGVQILNYNGNGLNLPDNKKVQLGTSSDLQLFHDGSNSYIEEDGTGQLILRSWAPRIKAKYSPSSGHSTGEDALICMPDGAVELYHNNVKTFETATNGAFVLGPEGGDCYIYLLADEGDDNADKWRIKSDTSGNFGIGTKSTGSYVDSLIIDSSGRLLVGHTSSFGGAKLQVHTTGAGGFESNSWYNGADPCNIYLRKSRGGSVTSYTVVQDDDGLGAITFAGSDGDSFSNGAKIQASVDGTPGDADMPSRLTFHTSADGTTNLTERMRLTSAGKIGINIADNTTGDLQVCSAASGLEANGLLRVGGNENNNVGLDINYSNSGNTSTIFKQNYVANNAGALMQFDSGYFVWRTGTSLTTALTINASQNATFAGTVSDSKGDLRKIPQNYQTSAYTLVAADAGKHIYYSGSAAAITVPANVFSVGDAITIISANSSTDITIAQGTSVTIYNAADGATGTRTLASKGMATLICVSGTNTFAISGAGLS